MLQREIIIINKQAMSFLSLMVLLTIFTFLVFETMYSVLLTPIYYLLSYNLFSNIKKQNGKYLPYVSIAILEGIFLLYYLLKWETLYKYLNVLSYAFVISISILIITIPLSNWSFLHEIWVAKKGIPLLRKVLLSVTMLVYCITLLVLGYIFHFTDLIPL